MTDPAGFPPPPPPPPRRETDEELSALPDPSRDGLLIGEIIEEPIDGDR